MLTPARRAAVTLLAAAALGAGLTGCSSDSLSEANQQFCSSVATVVTQLNKLDDTAGDSTATVEDVRTQAEAVKDAASAASGEAADLSESARTAYTSATEAFTKAIGDIPDNATVDQAKAAARAATATLISAVNSTKTAVGCV